MKISIFLSASLAVAVAAIPRHRAHRHQHHDKREETVIDIVTDIVTATSPAAILYVDGNGHAVSTSFMGQGGYPTGPPSPYWPAPAPSSGGGGSPPSTDSPPASESSQAAAPSSNSPPDTSAPPPVSSAPPPDTSTPLPPSNSPSPSTGSGGGTGSGSGGNSGGNSGSGSGAGLTGYALSYSPYLNNGQCKSQAQVSSDFANLPSDQYGTVRIYGTDCGQVPNVLQAAKLKGWKIMAGVFDLNNVTEEVDTIIAAANGDWSAIDTVSIGNEALSSGNSADAVVSAIGTARTQLQGTGFSGKVVTVDTVANIIANPQICQASDFAAANAHAFFDPNTSADQAGAFVQTQVSQVKAACPGKNVIITESGWPSSGQANGAAVPSEANQQAAIASLRAAFKSDIVLFSAYNDGWKTNTPGTFDAEQFWGIYGTAPSCQQ